MKTRLILGLMLLSFCTNCRCENGPFPPPAQSRQETTILYVTVVLESRTELGIKTYRVSGKTKAKNAPVTIGSFDTHSDDQGLFTGTFSIPENEYRIVPVTVYASFDPKAPQSSAKIVVTPTGASVEYN